MTERKNYFQHQAINTKTNISITLQIMQKINQNNNNNNNNKNTDPCERLLKLVYKII